MKQYIKNILPSLVLVNLFWFGNRICTIPNEYWHTKVLHPVGLYFFGSVLCLCAFKTTSYSNLSWKVLYLYLFLIVSSATVLYCAVQLYIVLNFSYEYLAKEYKENPTLAIDRILPGARHMLNFAQQAVLIAICLIHLKVKRLDKSKSDTLSNDTIFIVLVYPKDWMGILLLSFWKLPINTANLYYKGYLYGFKKKEGMMVREKSSFKELEACFIKNTHLSNSVEKILFNLVGAKWSIGRNCLNVFDPVIGKITNYI